MPDRLSLHAPTLVNTIGHAAGLIVFGLLLYLFLTDQSRGGSNKRLLPTIAAALACVWNVGSLVGLGTSPTSGFLPDLVIAISFSVLSFLPAVLLHISTRSKFFIYPGYVLSLSAAVLHILDLITGSPRFHYAAILLITLGFGALTGIVLIHPVWKGSDKGSSHRLFPAMMLFFFSISFAHFGPHHGHAWSGEVAFHHVGIPLAMFVLLQDYRFLLLDTFVRFLLNAFLAAIALLSALFVAVRLHFIATRPLHTFWAGLAFVAACVSLVLFGVARQYLQKLLTKIVFLRSNPDKVVLSIQELGIVEPTESVFLEKSAELISAFFGCNRFSWSVAAEESETSWKQTEIPVVFSHGDRQVLTLGARRGGRFFLSEDLALLRTFVLEVARGVDRLRAAELHALVLKTELQALQAQINPHFLFNTLNTIYGSIPRASGQARRLILHLADMLRYSLTTDRAFIPISDEVQMVRAYLEIEQARLGARLQTRIEVEEQAAQVRIPAFSIQPLIENAVKYGVASRIGAGFVFLAITTKDAMVNVSVENSGGFSPSNQASGNGVALKNVRRRLTICYGDSVRFAIEELQARTVVRFSVPIGQPSVYSLLPPARRSW